MNYLTKYAEFHLTSKYTISNNKNWIKKKIITKKGFIFNKKCKILKF